MAAVGITGLTITYQVTGGRPLSVATVEDDVLIRRAAQLAVKQAEREAAVAVEDPILGMLQTAEVRRLRAALSILIPGFTTLDMEAEGYSDEQRRPIC